ncbi:hypothetical protein ACIOUG_06180 [Pseudomonas sp. NPDC087803]|uniref:hypothetical protein n=1 Tax=Pseudomonas sp. NPDC087803 TaxID=3364448 RepID=UPI003813E646
MNQAARYYVDKHPPAVATLPLATNDQRGILSFRAFTSMPESAPPETAQATFLVKRILLNPGI